MKKIFSLTLLIFMVINLQANVKLPRIFSDNMVLQRSQPIHVWGWALPKEKVTVRLKQQAVSAVTDKTGKWKIQLAPEQAGGPFELQVIGKDTVVLKDILIGDVWICSGQSNMEWLLNDSRDADSEIAAANFPVIRHFKVPHAVASEPKDDVPGGTWEICAPATAGNFTAVGYFFARELYQTLQVPVGLLNVSWGGTHSETWTSREAFEGNDEFKTMIAGMPRLNLDSMAAQKSSAMKSKIEMLQGKFSYSPGEILLWKSTDYNDKKWPRMMVPGLWEGQEPGDLDGEVWLRKTVVIAPEDAGESAVLELGTIDDDDETYVNGMLVGAIRSYNTKRKYTVPAGILREGENVIAVKVTDTGGGGGFWGDAKDLKLTTATKMYPLAGEWPYQVAAVASGASSVGPNSYPTLLSNAMLNPVIPFAMKGVIWYQGESNAGRAYQYRTAFPLMITDWRKRWNQGDFPFYFVQLASFKAQDGDSRTGSTWAELREAQTLTLALPNTGMAVTTDIGDHDDIHPRNKQDVGKRLASIALNKTYGKNNLYGGPVYQGIFVSGGKVNISFSQAGGGLMTPDKYGYLRGFEIAGADQKFVYAKAWIEGDKVVVFQEGVTQPVAVRYGWADDAGECNLFNKEGFPAQPFRTDSWKGVTEGNKFGF